MDGGRGRRVWQQIADCAYILGWRKRSPAIQFKESEIEYLEVYTDEPDYATPQKIKVHLKSGAEIEIEDEAECISFGEIHKKAFHDRGGHFHYVDAEGPE
jgi:hypothetical protein